MNQFTIAETEKLTGIKFAIIKYWSSLIPEIKCNSTQEGCFYNQDTISLIFRLKYLIYTKKLSIEEAKQQLFKDGEVYQNNGQKLNCINELRYQLFNIHKIVQHSIDICNS